MADVSHELGALRFVVDSPLSSKVAMFNNQANQVQQSQLLNPFSASNSGRASPKPSFSKDEYGKPLAGSLTEMRGHKANMHVMREMLELCQIIDSEGYKVNDEPGMRVIPFGELFNIYNYISDKVVGILLRARKYKYVQFEGEMLFQRRDDDVPVFLLRPIQDIRHEIEEKLEMLKRSTSPAPMATTLLMDKGAHQQKLQENAFNAKSRSPSPAPGKNSSKPPTPTPPVKVTAPIEIAQIEASALEEEVQKLADVTITPTTSTSPQTVEEAELAAEIEQSAAKAPTPAQSTSNLAEISNEPIKTDLNNNDDNDNNIDIKVNSSDTDMIINELPTIVIEATTAIIDCAENGDDALEAATSTALPAAETAPTSSENPPSQPETNE